MKELKGKVAAVTGAASGLGRSMALAFAAEGMDLALADVDEVSLSSVQDEVLAKGVRAITLKVDVSQCAADRGVPRPDADAPRRRARGVQQRRRLAARRGVGEQRRRLAMDPRRQPVGRDPRRARLRAAPDRAGRGPYRQHRFGVRPDLAARLGRLQRHQARGGRAVGIAAPRPARAQFARRRLGAVPGLCARPASSTPSAAGPRNWGLAKKSEQTAGARSHAATKP